jgi:hypothetical protein
LEEFEQQNFGGKEFMKLHAIENYDKEGNKYPIVIRADYCRTNGLTRTERKIKGS